ncbi:probable G-protein coupled receptor Mth-like 4 [Homalodisca vitripennis]|uniref:probable G-protein coupled receptor Mth-like 4 n=1 Tax=Homalodisca vitripennis TaxID=197043 RepID=UPI001EEB727F|nr:probable G-protein coupled receptor Mth-like 4 [Homalodisca vitripennis]
MHENGNYEGCPCSFKTCVRKCCPRGQKLISEQELVCVNDTLETFSRNLNETVFFKIGKGQTLEDLHQKTMTNEDFFISSDFGCNEPGPYGHGSRFVPMDERTYLISDGTILTESLVYIDLPGYCLESLIESDEIITVRCVQNTLVQYSLQDSPLTAMFLLLLMFISVLALFVTIYIYAVLPQLQNINGKLLMCHMASLAIYFLSIVVAEICPDLGQFCLQTFLIGRTTWLTATCFELWLVFSRPLQHRKPRQHFEWNKFIYYSLFGWGIPLLSGVLSAAIGVVPSRSDSCPKPRFQDDPCLFSIKNATLMFSTFPVYLLVSLNSIMFFFTLFNLKNHFASREHLSTNKTAENSRERFWLYVKLSLLMGVNWVLMEIFYTESLQILAIPAFFYLVTVYLFSQGIIEFILLIVCNKRILNLVCEKWCIQSVNLEALLANSGSQPTPATSSTETPL